MSNTVFLTGCILLTQAIGTGDFPGFAIACLLVIGVLADIGSFVWGRHSWLNL